MTSKILVADDSITIQKIVAMAFENEDAVVEGIGNGKAAFEKLKNFAPDVVLADVDMPGYNGFELSRRIKESTEFKSVSVLLLASDFEDFNQGLFLESRADDHISKPFKSDDIVQKVKELLEHPPATLRDGDWQKEKDDLWDDDDEEEILSLSENDMIEESGVFELDTKDIAAPSAAVAAIEEAFAEPGEFPKAEPTPLQPWEVEEETALPWEEDDNKQNTGERAVQPNAGKTAEKGSNAIDAQPEEQENTDPAPSFEDASYTDAGSGDPLLALSTEDDDVPFELPPLDDEKSAALDDTENSQRARELLARMAEPRHTFELGRTGEETTDVEEDDDFASGAKEAPARPVSSETQAIDDVIEAVNELKKYSASMPDDSDTGLGIGFQSVEIKGEPESFEEKDFDPTRELELSSHESDPDPVTFEDTDFGIGLGFTPEPEPSFPRAFDDEEILSGIGESDGQDVEGLDVVFHPLAEENRRPRFGSAVRGENNSEGQEWNLDETIAPEPEDLLSNLVIHPLPSTGETSDAVPEVPPVFPAPPVSEELVTEEPSEENEPAPRLETPAMVGRERAGTG